tara:strand:- start:6084 stop:6479 length:396 start_codon:yes stop_codon:yes gene_type:complete
MICVQKLILGETDISKPQIWTGWQKREHHSTAKAPEIPIDRLAWHTGSWQGALNGGLLEDTWLPPKADTISALVRFSKDGKTEFVEIIKIEKVGNSFELRLQLYDPPMRPQSDKPHVFNLSKKSRWASMDC